MLEADFAAGLQKGVEVLVIVVLHGFRTDQGLDERLIGGTLAFQFLMSSNSPRRLAMAPLGSGWPSSVGDDAAGIDNSAAAGRARRDDRDLELRLCQAKSFVGELAEGLQALEAPGPRGRRKRAPG